MSLNHATVVVDDLQELEMEVMTDCSVTEPHLFLLQKKSTDGHLSSEAAAKVIAVTGILSVSF